MATVVLVAGTAFLSALVLFALSLAALLARTGSLSARDWALAVPYAAKAAIPVWIAAAAPPGLVFSEPRGPGVPLGILLLGFTVPGILVLGSLALAGGGQWAGSGGAPAGPKAWERSPGERGASTRWSTWRITIATAPPC